MDLLFNKDNTGNVEIKEVLGWINRSMKFDNLASDIELETPRLIEFIGKETYADLVTNYKKPNIPDSHKDAVRYAQMFIANMGYLSYNSSNDLQHSSSGRKQYKAENETAAWEWQIKADNGATMKRAYKALDRLIDELTDQENTAWLNGDAFKKSQNLLVRTTDDFDKIYPIDNSGQLYYRLVPFMEEVETEIINPLIDTALLERLKTATDLNAQEQLVLLHARRCAVYRSLAKGYRMLNLEMFPDNIQYSNTAFAHTKLLDMKILALQEDAEHFERALETAIDNQSGTDSDYALPDNSDTSQKFTSL